MKRIIIAIIIASACIVHADANLEKRVAKLEKEVAELKTALAPFMEKAKAEQIVTEQRNAARKRMREDSEIYSQNQLKETLEC